MRCYVCGRELKDDARFCDYCGAMTQSFSIKTTEQEETVFDWNFLFLGILISAGATILISLLFSQFGVPVFFGGLFLPFFFRRMPKKT